MTFKPVYKISETILHHLTTIAASASTVENAPLIPKWELSIRREALLRNAHASTAIEGNPLSLFSASMIFICRSVSAICNKQKITIGEIAKLFNFTRQAALKEVAKLVTLNVIALVGKGRGAYYVRK